MILQNEYEKLSAPGDSFPHYFDSSMLGAIVACPRQAYWAYVRGLVPQKTSIHLLAGGAFAAGTEAFRRAFYGQGKNMEDSFAAAWDAATLYWGDFEPIEETNKSYAAVLEAISKYFTEWWEPHTDLLQPHRRLDGKPSIEFSFSIPLPNLYHPVDGEPLFYVGRLDMLGIYNNQLMVVDEKTTTTLGAAWVNNWELRGQFTGYVWAVRTLLNLPVVGAVVRGIGFKKYEISNAEVLTFRPDWMLEAWLHRTTHAVGEFIDCWEHDYYRPAYDSACTSYGGCKFTSLCTKRDPEPWVNMEFSVNRWNPLAHQQRKEEKGLPTEPITSPSPAPLVPPTSQTTVPTSKS